MTGAAELVGLVEADPCPVLQVQLIDIVQGVTAVAPATQLSVAKDLLGVELGERALPHVRGAIRVASRARERR